MATKEVDRSSAKEAPSQSDQADKSDNLAKEAVRSDLIDGFKTAPTALFRPDGASSEAASKEFGNLQLVSEGQAGSVDASSVQNSSSSSVSEVRDGRPMQSSSAFDINSSSQRSSDVRDGRPVASSEIQGFSREAAGTPLESARARLLEASEAGQPGSSRDLRELMAVFEASAQGRGLSQEEILKTYREVGKLLEAKDNPEVPITAEQRRALATQVLQHAADPTSIDQGQHNTCNVATLEMRNYWRNPSEAARIVADVATTGRYVSRNGTTVVVDDQSLVPRNGAESLRKTDGVRDFAGQIFQVAAVNLYYQKENPNVRYEQRAPQPGRTPPDSGERLMDYSTNPPTEVGRPNLLFRTLGAEDAGTRQPDLTTDRLRLIGNEISGEKSGDWLLDYGNVRSPRELQERLEAAKRDGNMPLVVMVHTGNQPFFADSGNGAAGGSGGWHVVNITDYTPGNPPKVAIDNQWGSDRDRLSAPKQISSDMLYFSMSDPRNSTRAREMMLRAGEMQKEGVMDERFHLEALRRMHLSGNYTDNIYHHLFRASIRNFDSAYYRGNPPLPFSNDTWNLRMQAVAAMPLQSQIEMFNQMRSSGSISKETFSSVVVDIYGRSQNQSNSERNNRFHIAAQMREIIQSLHPGEQMAFRQEMLRAVGQHRRS